MDYKQQLIAKKVQSKGFKSKVEAKCIECIYDDQSSGTWRQQVDNCQSNHCPLHSVRPRATNKE